MSELDDFAAWASSCVECGGQHAYRWTCRDPVHDDGDVVHQGYCQGGSWAAADGHPLRRNVGVELDQAIARFREYRAGLLGGGA